MSAPGPAELRCLANLAEWEAAATWLEGRDWDLGLAAAVQAEKGRGVVPPLRVAGRMVATPGPVKASSQLPVASCQLKTQAKACSRSRLRSGPGGAPKTGGRGRPPHQKPGAAPAVCRVCGAAGYGQSGYCFEHLLAQTRIKAQAHVKWVRRYQARKAGAG